MMERFEQLRKEWENLNNMENKTDKISEELDSETMEALVLLAQYGYKEYKKSRMILKAKGFAMGLTTAVAVQSVITIFMIL